MHIVLLDVDGTLTNTNHIDELCLTAALETCLGLQGLSRDWSTYEHSTDSGIADEAVRRVHPEPPDHLYANIEREYMSRLDIAHGKQPEQFLPMQGARNIMPDLLWKGYAVGIATGCWKESALFKLRAAGIGHATVPISTADHHIDRRNILMHGILACRRRYAIEKVDSVTYVGDGVWDVRSAHAIGINFIGIGSERRRNKLIDAGANVVVESLDHIVPHLPH